MAEGLFTKVISYRGIVVAGREILLKYINKAEKSVCREAVLSVQRTYSVIRSVQYAVAVKDDHFTVHNSPLVLL